MPNPRIVVLIYGVLNILGGVMGFAMAKSLESLLAGGLLGLILVGCGVLAEKKPSIAFRVAGLVAFLLILFWGRGLLHNLQDAKSIVRPLGNLLIGVGVFAYLGYSHMKATASRKGA